MAEPIRRPSFFENQIVAPEDLNGSLEYGRAQLARHERYFGLVRPDGSLKPHAQVVKDFAATRPLVQKAARQVVRCRPVHAEAGTDERVAAVHIRSQRPVVVVDDHAIDDVALQAAIRPAADRVSRHPRRRAGWACRARLAHFGCHPAGLTSACDLCPRGSTASGLSERTVRPGSLLHA